jgi:hypothetical protein
MCIVCARAARAVLLPDPVALASAILIQPSTKPSASPSSPPIPRTVMLDAVVPREVLKHPGSRTGCTFARCDRLEKGGPFLYVLTVGHSGSGWHGHGALMGLGRSFEVH